MPPRRSTSGAGPKSQQSTLAFHGVANKVTKAGTRAQTAKKNIVSETVGKARKTDVAEIVPVEEKDEAEALEPTTAEAAIIDQTEKEVSTIQQADSTPEEDEARKITSARIEKYWDTKEKERAAPRLHQQDLTLHEKILREWDMSGQYGPCTGIARLKRWKRAHRLDLDPPIEVLAVLLKELDDGKDKVTVQRSHVDELLNSRSETVEA